MFLTQLEELFEVQVTVTIGIVYSEDGFCDSFRQVLTLPWVFLYQLFQFLLLQ